MAENGGATTAQKSAVYSEEKQAPKEKKSAQQGKEDGTDDHPAHADEETGGKQREVKHFQRAAIGYARIIVHKISCRPF